MCVFINSVLCNNKLIPVCIINFSGIILYVHLSIMWSAACANIKHQRRVFIDITVYWIKTKMIYRIGANSEGHRAEINSQYTVIVFILQSLWCFKSSLFLISHVISWMTLTVAYYLYTEGIFNYMRLMKNTELVCCLSKTHRLIKN